MNKDLSLDNVSSFQLLANLISAATNRYQLEGDPALSANKTQDVWDRQKNS